jgi:hypothetical protein
MCFTRLVHLKQTLMMSPHEYRIHFVPPGTTFDAVWMTPVDNDGHSIPSAECRNKRVKICLFPALAEHVADALGADAEVAEALVMNKQFFPTRQESERFKPTSTISKAVVIAD